jgi:carbohydrate-selective porin OprB
MRLIFLLAAAGMLIASGCAAMEFGTERSLGAVDYTEAFNAARTVMGQYFTVAVADADSGVVQSAPQPLAGGALGSAPTRQLARVRLRRVGGQVVAYASVSVQRQATAAMRQMARGDITYDGPPRQTPAQLEAATTPEQNESWITQRRDRELEFKILSDIQNALRSKEGS